MFDSSLAAVVAAGLLLNVTSGADVLSMNRATGALFVGLGVRLAPGARR